MWNPLLLPASLIIFNNNNYTNLGLNNLDNNYLTLQALVLKKNRNVFYILAFIRE